LIFEGPNESLMLRAFGSEARLSRLRKICVI
jgi:hypothetical protein